MIYNILSVLILAASFILMTTVSKQAYRYIKSNIDDLDKITNYESAVKASNEIRKPQNVSFNAFLGLLLLACYFIYCIVFPVNIWWINISMVSYLVTLILIYLTAG